MGASCSPQESLRRQKSHFSQGEIDTILASSQQEQSKHYNFRCHHNVIGLEKRHYRLYLVLRQINWLPREIANRVVELLFFYDAQCLVDDAIAYGWEVKTETSGSAYLYAPSHFNCRGWAHIGALKVNHYKYDTLYLTEHEFDESVRRTGDRRRRTD